MPLILGGAIAALLGFLAAFLGFAESDADPELEARLAAIDEQIAALPTGDEAQDMTPFTEAQTELGANIDTLAAETTSRLDAIDTTLSDLDARISAVERAPGEDGAVTDSAIASIERELEGLRTEIAAQEQRFQEMADEAAEALAAAQAEAQATEADAEAAAREAIIRAATARLRTAIDTGEPLAEPLNELSEAGVPVPDALAAQSETGVPTLASLVAAFPDTARAALADVRDASGQGGLGSLFDNMLQTRSVEPREGTDADAVLSRAEAAVRQNRLADALAELDSLQEADAAAASEALADWRAAAETRLAAVSAVNDIDPTVTQ